MLAFYKNLLADRSFWAALIALVTCVLVACNVPQGSIEQITSFIGGLGTIIAYIISNGITQAARIKADAAVRVAQARGTQIGTPH